MAECSPDYFPLRCNEVVKGNKEPKNEHKDNKHISYLVNVLPSQSLAKDSI